MTYGNEAKNEVKVDAGRVERCEAPKKTNPSNLIEHATINSAKIEGLRGELQIVRKRLGCLEKIVGHD